MSYGRTRLVTNQVFPTRVTADGRPEYKSGGLTLDLTVLPAAPTVDTTLGDGSIIRPGYQYLRYGQVLTRVTVVGTTVITVGATGGTYAFTITTNNGSITTSALAYNANAAAQQTELRSKLNTLGYGSSAVAVTGTGPWTYTFAAAVGPVSLSIDNTSATGGTVTQAVTSSGDTGKYGPYDPAANDGRATLTVGDTFILDETWLLNPVGTSSMAGVGSIDCIGNVIIGGSVYLDRVIQSGSATHTLAAGPTYAELMAAIPRLVPVKN